MNWKSIDQKKLVTELSKEYRGEILVSPYAIPEAFRVRIDPNTRDVILEFKYISPDTSFDQISLIDGVTLAVGKESKRVFKFILDAEYHKNSEECIELLNTALKVLTHKTKKSSSKEKVSRHLLDINRKELINALSI